MKNALSGLFLALMLVAPSLSYAQVVPSTPATISDLDALKMQLIQVLLQEVQILQAQLTALQAQQATTAADVATIKANTTPTGGAVDNTVKIPPFTVYKVAYEEPDQFRDIYYNGSKKLDVGSTKLLQDNGNGGGAPLDITFTANSQSRTINDSCWFYDDSETPLPNGKVCGGEMYRLTPSSQIPKGNYYVQIVSVDGDVYNTKHEISINN